MRFDFTEKFVGRMTAGEVMARPNPSQLAFRPLDTAHRRVSRVRSGNPDLLPFKANQYDVGFEYYFSDINYVSAAAIPHGNFAVHHQPHATQRK